MKQKVIILSAGGHAKVIIDTLELLGNFKILGITEHDEGKIGQKVMGISILGRDDEVIEKYSHKDIKLVNGMGGSDLPKLRRRLYHYWANKGYEFATIVHPAAYVAKSAKIGAGAQIMAGAIVQPEARIGDNTLINTNASIDRNSDIGNHCHVAPGVTISADVKIGDGSHLGTAAAIIQGITLGANVLVAAGAVVVSSFANDMRIKGVPARGELLVERH